MTKKVKCVSCRKTVTVKLVKFGGGYIGVCPKCDKLAYNKKKGEDGNPS